MTTPTDDSTNERANDDPQTPDNVVPLTPGAPAADGELCWLPVEQLAPHPDNPRSDRGDLTEMVRSIRSHGVIEPLVVLPADENGTHLIVAGHRRHAAAQEAGQAQVPAVIRAMTQTEVLETALVENINRSNLLVSDEVRAVERLMQLNDRLTPAKLCRRLGRSQAWVRARMAVTVLPAHWRAALDSGDLPLVAAEAAASAADLGPDHIDHLCERLAKGGWIEPAHVVSDYRLRLERDAAYAKAVKDQLQKAQVVYSDENPPPSQAKPLARLFDPETAEQHGSESCHAVAVHRISWGDGWRIEQLCTEPRRHSPRQVKSGNGSSLASDRQPAAGSSDDTRAKRRGRLSRLEHATDLWGKTRGGLSQTELTRLALETLVQEAPREALTFAATILGHDQARDVSADDLLATAATPKAMGRVAGAVACGIAETYMYWHTSSPRCQGWLDILTRSGWEPDEWTTTQLASADSPPSAPEPDDPGDDAEDVPEDDVKDQVKEHLVDDQAPTGHDDPAPTETTTTDRQY